VRSYSGWTDPVVMFCGMTKPLAAVAAKAKMSCRSMIVVFSLMTWTRSGGNLIEDGRRRVEQRMGG
jgi:hypothetical protein